MAYTARTKDDPGDVGRSADQQASVDNDVFFRDVIRYAEVLCFSFRDEETVVVGNGAGYLHIPADLAGMNLVEVHAEVLNAGAVGSLLTVQLHNVTQAADMLSTEITIDVAETGSDTAAAPAVIDGAEDDVAENDLIRVDVDTVHDTPPDGLIVSMGFQWP